VCQPKEFGGLGVKDVHLMNLSLLAKWRWRLLYGDNALWKEVLEERYGRKVRAKLDGGEDFCPTNASKWWKGLVNLDKKNGRKSGLMKRWRGVWGMGPILIFGGWRGGGKLLL